MSVPSDLPSPPFSSASVASVFAQFPNNARIALLKIRALIFDVAGADPLIGPLEETLKWGQPSYLTPVTSSGTTIRLWAPKSGGFGVYTHCQTTVMDDFQNHIGAGLVFDGTRGVTFDDGEEPPLDRLRPLVQYALTYHRKS